MEEGGGCHSNCVIMLVATMKAMETGWGIGLVQRTGTLEREPNCQLDLDLLFSELFKLKRNYIRHVFYSATPALIDGYMDKYTVDGSE